MSALADGLERLVDPGYELKSWLKSPYLKSLTGSYQLKEKLLAEPV